MILLDLLSRESRLHYAGDFDPEGLGIAQRLKDRYGSRLELWEYKPEYYLRARSAENLPEGMISPERMKKLDKLRDAELVKSGIESLERRNGVGWSRIL